MYQVSNHSGGPWLELVVTNNPQQALDAARAKMMWPIVWVAEMKPLTGEDLLPGREVMWGEIMERLSVMHGNSIANQFAEGAHIDELYASLCSAATRHLAEAGGEVVVPAKKHSYGREHNIRDADFKE